MATRWLTVMLNDVIGGSGTYVMAKVITLVHSLLVGQRVNNHTETSLGSGQELTGK